MDLGFGRIESLSHRTARREAVTHLYAIGQLVRVRSSFDTFPKTDDIYHVTGTLPLQGDSPQYRIRKENEVMSE
jgi:hypothetical protein